MPQDIADVRTFRALIHWLAARHHAGHFFPMAQRIGVSSALVDQWQRGVVKRPTIESVEKVCGAYDLDLLAVLRLVTSRPRRSPRKPLPISGGSDNFRTLPVETEPNALPLIRRWLGLLLGSGPLCPQLA